MTTTMMTMTMMTTTMMTKSTNGLARVGSVWPSPPGLSRTQCVIQSNCLWQ